MIFDTVHLTETEIIFTGLFFIEWQMVGSVWEKKTFFVKISVWNCELSDSFILGSSIPF